MKKLIPFAVAVVISHASHEITATCYISKKGAQLFQRRFKGACEAEPIQVGDHFCVCSKKYPDACGKEKEECCAAVDVDKKLCKQPESKAENQPEKKKQEEEKN